MTDQTGTNISSESLSQSQPEGTVDARVLVQFSSMTGVNVSFQLDITASNQEQLDAYMVDAQEVLGRLMKFQPTPVTKIAYRSMPSTTA